MNAHSANKTMSSIDPPGASTLDVCVYSYMTTLSNHGIPAGTTAAVWACHSSVVHLFVAAVLYPRQQRDQWRQNSAQPEAPSVHHLRLTYPEFVNALCTHAITRCTPRRSRPVMVASGKDWSGRPARAPAENKVPFIPTAAASAPGPFPRRSAEARPQPTAVPASCRSALASRTSKPGGGRRCGARPRNASRRSGAC